MQKKKIKNSKEIGERIKKRRKGLGISQERLAEILGVTYQQVQRYENGINRLNVENIQLIADALSVPMSYFFASDKLFLAAEEQALYIPADESKLLRCFRRIKNKNSKNTVIQVAKIAAKINDL